MKKSTSLNHQIFEIRVALILGYTRNTRQQSGEKGQNFSQTN